MSFEVANSLVIINYFMCCTEHILVDTEVVRYQVGEGGNLWHSEKK